MPKPAALGLALLLMAVHPAARAQDRSDQIWPELDVYLQLGSRVRAVFTDSTRTGPQSNGNSAIAYYLEVALRPVLRRELRDRNDVFRKRYLTFRGGYRYSTNLSGNNSNIEHRAIAETTARYPLPLGILLNDRNRGEFRFRAGQPFSMRYRNRLWLDRALKFRSLVIAPYIYGELFYDTRFGAWARNRSAIGVQIPVGPHFQVEPYALRQNNTRSNPRHTNAAGLTLSLFF